MTANLDKLMTLEGAIASGEFSMEGELVASRAEAAKDCSDLMEMILAAKLFMGNIEHRLEEKGENNYTDAGFTPIKGIALSAGE